MKENPEMKRGGHKSHKLLVAMTPFAKRDQQSQLIPQKLLPRSANHKKASFRVTGVAGLLAPSHPPLRIRSTLQLPPFMGDKGVCAPTTDFPSP